MSKRESFTVFEEIVVDLYEDNKLDRDILCMLWRKFSEYLPMDAGGYDGYLREKGKTMCEIVCEVLNIDLSNYWGVEDYHRESIEEAEMDEFITPNVVRAQLYFFEELHQLATWRNLK